MAATMRSMVASIAKWAAARELHFSRCDDGLAARFDVAHRWLTEEAAVFAAELACAFVADLEGCARGIEAVAEHALSRHVESKLLLVLKRAHCGEGAEVMMERRYSHSRYVGEFFDTQRFRVVRSQPCHGLGGFVALLSEGGDCAEMTSLRMAKQAIDDLALDQAAEEGDVVGCVEKVDEAGARTEKLGRGD